MKLQNISKVVLALTLGTFFQGCVETDEEIFRTEHTVVNWDESDQPENGDLYADECSMVYLTNKLRAITTSNHGYYQDDPGFIARATLDTQLVDRYNDPIYNGTSWYNFGTLNYNQTAEIVLAFPETTTGWETVNAGFKIGLSNMGVKYASSPYTEYTNWTIDGYRDCYYIYFITLFNDASASPNARLAQNDDPNIEIVPLKQVANSNQRVDGKTFAAVSKFDVLGHFAKTHGFANRDAYKAFLTKIEVAGRTQQKLSKADEIKLFRLRKDMKKLVIANHQRAEKINSLIGKPGATQLEYAKAYHVAFNAAPGDMGKKALSMAKFAESLDKKNGKNK